MSFRPVDFAHLAKFNSAASSDLVEKLQLFWDEDIREEDSKPSSRTIAPSSLRCLRRTWFRLRGTEPDSAKSTDRVLNFSARIGDACHELLQRKLSEHMGEDWVSLEHYLKENPIPHTYKLDPKGFETRIAFEDIPIRFACDGIVRIMGEYRLLEIKSSDFSSWDDLTEPKPHHIKQVQCYATLLNLPSVLMVYIDRQYGGLKCYEVTVKQYEMDAINQSFKDLMLAVATNLAPEPLPKGDSWCSANMCPYFKKCKEYGR